MKKFTLLSLVLLFSFTQMYGQAEKSNIGVSGKVTDSSSGVPLEYATISLFLKDQKKPVTGTTTNSAGYFSLTALSPGDYSVVAEFIGYRPFAIHSVIVGEKNGVVDLKNIGLTKRQVTLKNVSITVQGKLIENKIDKTVFNAERDLTSQTGVATDILKKVPMVSVDVNGNVELAGSSSIRFLVDGKPSSAFGSNITDVLQSIPASQIKSVEVITNPGAKYDAEGLGGIINIILKKNSARGINGNLSLTAGTRMENGSFNFSARRGTFGLNAFISGNTRLASKTPSSFNRSSTDTAAKSVVLLNQEGVNQFKRHGYQTGIGFDYTYKTKNNFSGSISYNNFGNSGNGYQDQVVTESNFSGNIVPSISTYNSSINSSRFHNVDANLNYTRKFNRDDQELEINVSTSKGNNSYASDNKQLALPDDSLFYATNNNNGGKENETEIEVNYTQPLAKEVRLGAGGKLNLSDISSAADVLMFHPSLKEYLYDVSLSNSLDYHQKVYAFYTELTFPVFKLFNAKIGGRYERTEINSFYSNAQAQVKAPGYNTFVPSVFFFKKVGESQTVKLSYSKRIERPGYGDLNPFINTGDPKNISAGNPFLLPETGSRYELSYSRDLNKMGSVMVSLFFRTNNNDIQPYIVYYPSFSVGDSTYTNVAVSTRENIGTEKNAGVNVFGDLKITPELNVRTNLFFFHRHTINALDPGFNSNSFNYRLNMNASYQFTKLLAAEFFGNFNSARNEVQGRYPSFTSYSIAIRQQFWKKKGSLALTATNPFNEYVKQRTAVFGRGFIVNSIRKIPFRSIGINFTWKFGKLEFKKQKEEDNGNLNAPAE